MENKMMIGLSLLAFVVLMSRCANGQERSPDLTSAGAHTNFILSTKRILRGTGPCWTDLGSAGASANEDFTCDEVLICLSPCKPYLGSDPTPSNLCCESAKRMAARANSGSPFDIKNDMCECFRKHPFNPAKLEKLPELCQVNFPFSLDPSVACPKSS